MVCNTLKTKDKLKDEKIEVMKRFANYVYGLSPHNFDFMMDNPKFNMQSFIELQLDKIYQKEFLEILEEKQKKWNESNLNKEEKEVMNYVCKELKSKIIGSQENANVAGDDLSSENQTRGEEDYHQCDEETETSASGDNHSSLPSGEKRGRPQDCNTSPANTNNSGDNGGKDA